MKKHFKLVYGFGINDADYFVQRFEYQNGKCKRVWVCPIYVDWKSMLSRVFSKKVSLENPTYAGTTICDEWKYFSNFRDWVLNGQPVKSFEDCQLDKDIIYLNNKHYSPQTCCYVPPLVNSFITDRKNDRGVAMLGVSYMASCDRYIAACNDPLGRYDKYSGCYKTELEAHIAWKNKKHAYAQELLPLIEDPRAREALRVRYE